MSKVNEILSAGFLAGFKATDDVTPASLTADGFWDAVEFDILAEYGDLEASSIVEYMSDSETLSTALYPYISARYLDKWRHTLAVLEEAYDPLWNVDGTETVTNSGTDTFTAGKTDIRTLNTEDGTTYGKSQTRTHADTDTRTLNTSDGTTYGKSETDTHYISGDNGGEVQSGRDVKGNSGTDTTNHTGTDTMVHTGTITDADTGKDTTTHSGTDTLARSGQDTTVYGHKIVTERAGNIGVTSSQSLLTQELDVRARTYFNIVRDDVKSVVCGLIWEVS